MLLKRLKPGLRSFMKFKKPIIPLIILFSVIILGSIGYMYLWRDYDSTFVDAFYMTFITITTIGYGEIHPLDSTGRIFTIIIGVAGIGSLFFILSVIMENLFEIQLMNLRGIKKMFRKIDSMNNHIILVGYGRVGQLAANELQRSGKPFVVISGDFDDKHSTKKDAIVSIIGDATNDDILLKAGIERAAGMVVTTPNSAVTVFVVLSAKVLNPKIFIVARADEDSDINKIIRAGADRVVNPYSTGGQRMAALMVNPHAIEFFDTNLGSNANQLNIEKVVLSPDSIWYSKSLIELGIRQKSGASILAIIRNGSPIVNPDGNFIILPGDELIVLGTRKQLENFGNLSIG